MRTIVRGGLVVDCTGRDPVPGGVVAIEDGRIVAVGRAAEFSADDGGAVVVDASGCTVLPGLIDGHVHVLNAARRSNFTEAEAAAWASNYLRSALQGGVTTVRDLGAQHEAIFALRRGVQSGWIVGPRLLVAGAAICMTGGHGHDTFSFEADGPDAVRRAARQRIKAGVDVVKFMATGGSGTRGEHPTAPQLSMEEMRAGVEAAQQAEKPTAAHATSSAGAKNALLAGVNSIEHGCHLDDEVIGLMLERGATLSPTLSIYQRIVDGGKAGLAPDFSARRAADLVGPHLESFRKALAAGVTVAMGTDSGSPYHPLGDIAYELELWVQAGMNPLAALEAATRVAAGVCRIDQEVGTLEAGKLADLLIVEGDPTADIAAIRRVRRVFRDGLTVYDSGASRALGDLIARPVMGPLPKWLSE